MAEQLRVNPWMKIWVEPRQTIRAIVEYNPKYRFLFLSILYGLPMLLNFAQTFSLSEQFSFLAISIGALILAPFIGMIGISIGAALIFWTGKWIGGTASFLNVRAALAWSNVPNLVSVLLWSIMIGFFKNTLFLENFAQAPFDGSQLRLIFTVFFLQTALSIWSFIILIKSLGEVQGFSAWKGLLNILIPFFLIGIVIWLISTIIMLVGPSPTPV